MTTPADEITAAANRLRALTADATEGPWTAEDPNTRWGDDQDHRIIGGGKTLATFSSDHNGPLNADYTAAMHPGVAKAIAAWLQVEAFQVMHNGRNLTTTHHALTVARQILGSQP